MFKLNSLVGFGGKTVIPVTSEFVASKTFVEIITSTTATFQSANIGSADPNRYNFICLGFESDSTVTACTIGGISATSAVNTVNTVAAPDIGSSIWYANVPTGTVADIIFTGTNFDTTNPPFLISIYKILNFGSTSFAETSGNTTALSRTLNVPAGSAVIAASARAVNTQTTVWTNLTEDMDADDLGGGVRLTSANDEFLLGNSSLTVTATGSASGQCTLSCVIINPA